MLLMKALVVIKKSNPLTKTAEKVLEHKNCEWVETVTGSIDAIAKFSGTNERELYELGFKTNEIFEIQKVLKGKNKELFFNVPFWYKIRIDERIDELEKYLMKEGVINEVYFSGKFVWIRGCCINTFELDEFESKLWENFGKYIKEDETYVVFRRFKKKRLEGFKAEAPIITFYFSFFYTLFSFFNFLYAICRWNYYFILY